MKHLAVTGHRPPKLGGYQHDIYEKLYQLAIDELMFFQPDLVITGMALGWDIAVAKACIFLKMPFIAAVPFPGQESNWPPFSQREYNEVLMHARKIVHVSDRYSPTAMQRRNEWMVDRCHALLALYDGYGEGGTFKCIKYARKRKKPVRNIWSLFHENHTEENPYRACESD